MWGPRLLLLLIVCIVAVAAFDAAPLRAQTTAPAPAASATDALPTMKELRAQFKDENYQDVLKQIQRLLQLKGDTAKPYNRYELLCLRGECFLRTGSMPLAAEAFDEAAEAARDESKREGVARGTAVLIRRSKAIGYTPRPPKTTGAVVAAAAAPKPMPIVLESDRKSALTQLLADERAIVEPKVKAAQDGRALPPVIEAGRMLYELWAVEVAATGSGEQTRALSKALGEHAHELIATALDDMNEKVEAAFAHASKETWTRTMRGGRELYRTFNGRIGLHGPGRADVQFAMQTTEKIVPAAAELAKVTDNDALKRDADIARKLHARAVYILDFKYQTLRQDRRAAPPAPRAGGK